MQSVSPKCVSLTKTKEQSGISQMNCPQDNNNRQGQPQRSAVADPPQRGMGESNSSPLMAHIPTKDVKYTDRHECNLHQAYSQLGVSYMVQPVLNWVESLAATTELAEKQQYQQRLHPLQQQQPITLQGAQLSAPSIIPTTAPWLLPATGMAHIFQQSADSSSPKNGNSSGSDVVVNNGKKDLSQYMTNWLLQHWMNPYPDDDGLDQMASDCETTQAVVSNWLINARTRKWRPAIVKARDMRRPAHLLRKDSMAIFAGQDVADLNDILCNEKEWQQQPAIVAPLRHQPFQIPIPQPQQQSPQTSLQPPPLQIQKPPPHTKSSLIFQSQQPLPKRLKTTNR